jgi:hypothetical protein
MLIWGLPLLFSDKWGSHFHYLLNNLIISSLMCKGNSVAHMYTKTHMYIFGSDSKLSYFIDLNFLFLRY